MGRTAAIWLIAVLGPFALVSGYLVLTRWPESHFTATSDYIAVILAVALGIAAIQFARIPLRHRVLLSVIYAAAGSFLLALYALGFVCVVFQSCL